MSLSLSLDEVCAAVPAATGELLGRVADVAATEGFGLHLVGGPVRDLVLGRALVDVDLVVEGEAKALAEAVCRGRSGRGLRFVPHDRFGTVRVESERASLDLATARHESYAHPGALPEVSPGTLEQDAHRRDFSINALRCPLDGERPGRPVPIVDGAGGLVDLAQKRLRILHERSFHDDPTRAWRAARFAIRLGFRLDRSSRAALRAALRDGAFGSVSGERYRRELQLAFGEAQQGAHVGQILRSLSDWHVLAALEPGLELDRGALIPLRRLSRSIATPDWPTARWRGWVAGLSLWLAPLSPALRRRTLDRFSIRGEQSTRIAGFGRAAERALASLARARGRGAVDAILGAMAEEQIQAIYASAGVPVRRRMLRWGAEDRRRRSPVSGDDLVEIGLQGPDIGRALERIRAGFLDGEVANREEALALAGEMARRGEARRRSAGRRKSPPQVARSGAIADTPPSVDGGSTSADESDDRRPKVGSGEGGSKSASERPPDRRR